jgi:2-polyprenyl-6-methoxyphenol hydroxylase-like FAD-dependent oxidoreductase
LQAGGGDARDVRLARETLPRLQSHHAKAERRRVSLDGRRSRESGIVVKTPCADLSGAGRRSSGPLKNLLLDAAESAGAEFAFKTGCAGLDFTSSRLLLRNEQNGTIRNQSFDTVIAMDGAGSVVCHAMAEQDYNQVSDEHLTHGYKELTIPAGRNGATRLEKNALHIWPRGGFMLIVPLNTDGRFTCTLFLPHAGPTSFEMLRHERSVITIVLSKLQENRTRKPSLIWRWKIMLRCATLSWTPSSTSAKSSSGSSRRVIHSISSPATQWLCFTAFLTGSPRRGATFNRQFSSSYRPQSTGSRMSTSN